MIFNDNYFLFALLIVYCTISVIMFVEKWIYFIRCTYDLKFRNKQPALWRKATIQDMILSITFTWLPVIIIKAVVDSLS